MDTRDWVGCRYRVGIGCAGRGIRPKVGDLRMGEGEEEVVGGLGEGGRGFGQRYRGLRILNFGRNRLTHVR
jgi:hypothetical protein